MLYKRTSDTARHASFLVSTDTPDPSPDAAAPRDENVLTPPSPEQAEIARLHQENAALLVELEALRGTWETALEAAGQRALKLAAERHISDDAARIAALRRALGDAQAVFAAALEGQALPLAQALAHDALARLVVPKAEEDEWLARLISRRLNELRGDAVVELRLAESFEDEALASLRQGLPPGAAVVADPALRPRTARLGLRLGGIEIEPACGLAAVLALLDGDRSDG